MGYIILELGYRYAWSDSQITLSWIRSSPHRWKTFVSNRVAYIQEKVPPASWSYVNTKMNPADIASRGSLPSELLHNSMWFNGPEFLNNNTNFLTDIPNPLLDSTVLDTASHAEEKKVAFTTFSSIENFLDKLVVNYSSFSFIQRTLAFILRFVNNTKPMSLKYSGPLQVSELKNALYVLVKRTQEIYFEDEFNSKSFSKPLRKLGIFLDNENILRVGGRLKYSLLSYDAKHPVLLPRISPLTTLIITYFHEKHLHAGVGTLHFLLAQHFWVLHPRRSINSVIHKCITCWKTKPKSYQPPMGVEK